MEEKETKSELRSLHIPEELWKKVEEIARKEYSNASVVIRRLLKERIEQLEENKKS